MGKYLVPGTPLAGEHSPAENQTNRVNAEINGQSLSRSRFRVGARHFTLSRIAREGKTKRIALGG